MTTVIRGSIIIRARVRRRCVAVATRLRRREFGRGCGVFAGGADGLFEFVHEDVLLAVCVVGAYEARILARGEHACDVRSGHAVEESWVEVRTEDDGVCVVAAVVVRGEHEAHKEGLFTPGKGVEGGGGDEAVSDSAQRHRRFTIYDLRFTI